MISNFLNNPLLQQYLNRNFAQPVDTGMPVQNKLYQQPYNIYDVSGEGITSIPINIEDDEEEQYPYLGYDNMRYETPRTIADQNRVLGQTFTEQKPSGIARLFEVLGNIPTPFNLARRGLESLSGFNQRLRATDFGRSKTLAEYFDRRSRAKNAARMAEKYKEFSERDPGDRGKGMESSSAVGGVYGGGPGGLHSGE